MAGAYRRPVLLKHAAIMDGHKCRDRRFAWNDDVLGYRRRKRRSWRVGDDCHTKSPRAKAEPALTGIGDRSQTHLYAVVLFQDPSEVALHFRPRRTRVCSGDRRKDRRVMTHHHRIILWSNEQLISVKSKHL